LPVPVGQGGKERDSQENAPSDKMVPENIKVIRVATKDSLAITRYGFSKVSALLENIKREILNAADFYRQGKTNEASVKIVKIMEAIKPFAWDSSFGFDKSNPYVYCL
jgi:hypothetical protein